jgi:hypothetical protein
MEILLWCFMVKAVFKGKNLGLLASGSGSHLSRLCAMPSR